MTVDTPNRALDRPPHTATGGGGGHVSPQTASPVSCLLRIHLLPRFWRFAFYSRCHQWVSFQLHGVFLDLLGMLGGKSRPRLHGHLRNLSGCIPSVSHSERSGIGIVQVGCFGHVAGGLRGCGIESAGDQGPIVQAVITVTRCVRVAQVGLILFLLVFSRYLGVSWKQQSFGLSLGLGLSAGVELGHSGFPCEWTCIRQFGPRDQSRGL